MTKHGITMKQLRESVPSNEDFSDIEEEIETNVDELFKQN